MDVAAMARRCPASRPLGVARLVRHRFFISGDGLASVARDPRRNVWGLLWDLAFADVPALDRYEELSTGLYAKVVQPVLTGQGSRRAMLYVGRSTAPGTPKPSYMEGIVSAARAAGLPAEYQRELETWLPNAPSSGDPVQKPAVRPRWSAPTSVRRPPRPL
jgi:hypothetical protein